MNRVLLTKAVAEERLVKDAGPDKAFDEMVVEALCGELKILLDGRHHVVRIAKQKPRPDGHDGKLFHLSAVVEHCLADPDVAEMGEFVYHRSLEANDPAPKDDQLPLNTHRQGEFVREAGGWFCRVAPKRPKAI